MFTVLETSRFLKVRPSVVFRLLDIGKIKSARINGKLSIPAQDIINDFQSGAFDEFINNDGHE